MLERLNHGEQRALLELLIYIARADGTVVQSEAELLKGYADVFDFDIGGLTGGFEPEELITRFESPASGAIAIQELLRLSHLDGEFASGEQDAIYEIAELMGFDPDYVEQLDRWVVDGLNWVWRGEELVGAANSAMLDDEPV